MKGNPFRCLILDNVQNNMGDAAIALAMTSSLKETFGDDSIIKICYCGVTADPGEFTSHYPELNFTRTLWHAVYDGSSPNRTIWSTIVRKSAAYRLPLQAKLSSFGLPNMLLLPGEKELLDEFREADVVVVSGGGFLNTSWTPPSRRSLRIGEYKTALNLKIPLVFYAQSFGPFAENDPFSKQLLPVLRKASAVLCRDLESVDILTNYIGVDTNNIITTIDEALLLHSRPPSRELSPAKIKPLRIGICVHQWLWEKAENGVELQSEFERKIAQASRKLLEQGNVEIALISTHQGIVRALHSDEEVVTRIYYQIPELLRTNVHIVEGFVHPAEFAHFMGHCDLVISSRLHGGNSQSGRRRSSCSVGL